jgi:hypothetical protein
MDPQLQDVNSALEKAKQNLASAEVMLAKDINERKKIQQELQNSQSHEYLNSLFKTLCVAEQEQRAIVRELRTSVRIEKELLLLQRGQEKSVEGNSEFSNFNCVFTVKSTKVVTVRCYENTFRLSFIKSLFNNGKGIVVSKEYFLYEKASRSYSNKANPILMERCRSELRQLNWEETHLRFEKVEIDCVLRCYLDNSREILFEEPAKRLIPKTSPKSLPLPPLTQKISDDSVDGELDTPNSYIVVEISSKSQNMVRKLVQLEKDLLLLLTRRRIQQNDNSVNIESIIGFAFLVLPYSPLTKAEMDQSIENELCLQRTLFPLLFRLYEYGRFARFYTAAGVHVLLNEMATHISDNFSSSYDKGDSGFKYNDLYVLIFKIVGPGFTEFDTMDDFYLSLEKELINPSKRQQQLELVKNVFHQQDIEVSILSTLTYEKLEKYGIKQGGLRSLILKTLSK